MHLGLFANEDLISVISIFSKNDEIQFRKFATVATHQGKGYGTVLLKHVFGLAEKLKARRIWCNARYTKKSYYEKFQMTAINAPFEKSGILYVIMEKLIAS